jgi:hypothetical protein
VRIVFIVELSAALFEEPSAALFNELGLRSGE